MIAAAKPEAEDIAVLEKAGLRVMLSEAQVLKLFRSPP
jgi:hypothetical protein